MSRPTTTVTVGEAGKLIFSPSSLNASAGSVIAFDFLGLNHTLTQSTIGNPCRSNQGLNTGFQQFNPVYTTSLRSRIGMMVALKV
jgi:plastocyanin